MPTEFKVSDLKVKQRCDLLLFLLLYALCQIISKVCIWMDARVIKCSLEVLLNMYCS